MKVGIVSIYDNKNLGNRLQNYALQQYLLKYADQVLTIRNDIAPPNLVRKFKRIFVGSPWALWAVGRKKECYAVRFNRKYIRISSKCYIYSNANSQLGPKDRCDYYCVGSDQVWNPKYDRWGMFNYLGFAPSERTFSYAASFGIDEIPEEHRQAVAEGLKHIRYISVREDAGKKIVEELTGRTDAQVLVDPTMLLTRQEWDQVVKKPKGVVPQKYVLTYFLGDVSEERKAAILARTKELGCELIEIMDPNSPFNAVGPDEFVWLIKNATYICTDSFHGSVFSFLYGRPFAVFDRQDKWPDMGSRMKTFMAKFSLGHCAAVGNVLPEYCASPDYSLGNKALEEERVASKKYLDQVFRELKG